MATGEIKWNFRELSAGTFKARCRKGLAQAAKKDFYPLPFPAGLLLLVIFIIAQLSAAQSSKPTVRHHRVEDPDPSAALLTEAEADIEQENYSGAESLLKKFLEAHPDSYSAWYDLGYVYHALGQKDESIAAYRKSVAAKPDVFESTLNLGLALADSGQPEAEQYLRQATRLKPGSNPAQGQKRAWMALARFLEIPRPEDALAAFNQAAALDPKDPEPHLLAGALLEKERRSKEAEKEYQVAIAISPANADALTALVNLYMGERRFEDAEGLLRNLLTLRPNDASAHFQLGRMLALSGKTEDAIAELETGLKLDPTDANAQRDLADLYADSGKYGLAQQLYLALIASHPNDAGLHYAFGKSLLKQKQFAEAEQQLEKAVELQPDLGAAYGDLAIAADQNKDYSLAIKASDLRSKYLPEIPMSYFLRATAYDHLHDAKQAAKYYHLFLGVAGGKYPDQEWQAKHRLIAIEPK